MLAINLSAIDIEQLNTEANFFVDLLEEAGLRVSGCYRATKETDPGIEIDGKYILQCAFYCNPQFLLDRVESPGEEIFEAETLEEVIDFLKAI